MPFAVSAEGMALLLFGTDPDSGGANCPAVWVETDAIQGPELVLQGRFADAATRSTCGQDVRPQTTRGSSGSRSAW